MFTLSDDFYRCDCVHPDCPKHKGQACFERSIGEIVIDYVNTKISMYACANCKEFLTNLEHKPVELKTAELNGKKIAYSTVTEFLVQIGKGTSAYKTRNKVVGNLGQAVMLYNGINIGNGYKKRLLMPSSKKPVLARQFS